MTQETEWVSGGLVFLGTRHMDMTDTSQQVAAVLEAWGARVHSITISTARTASVSTADHDVKLTLHRDNGTIPLRGAAGVFMNVAIAARSQPQSDKAVPIEAMLVHVRRALHKAYASDPAQKQDTPQPHADQHDTLRPADAGVPGRNLLQPRKPVRMRMRASPQAPRALHCPPQHSQSHHEHEWNTAPDDQVTLRNAMRAHDPINTENQSQRDRVRLSAWFLSISVALLCLPLGVTLAVINMLRGENLRLASQTAALTGTFVSLQASGATAQAAELIQSVLR